MLLFNFFLLFITRARAHTHTYHIDMPCLSLLILEDDLLKTILGSSGLVPSRPEEFLASGIAQVQVPPSRRGFLYIHVCVVRLRVQNNCSHGRLIHMYCDVLITSPIVPNTARCLPRNLEEKNSRTRQKTIANHQMGLGTNLLCQKLMF